MATKEKPRSPAAQDMQEVTKESINEACHNISAIILDDSERFVAQLATKQGDPTITAPVLTEGQRQQLKMNAEILLTLSRVNNGTN